MLDFLDGRRRVTGKFPWRVRRAQRCRVRVGGCHERGHGIADHWHVKREFDVADGAEIGRHPHEIFGPRVARHRNERDGIRNVDGQRPGLRATHGHHHRCMEVGAVEVSERRDGVTHLRQPLAWCHHRQAQPAQFVFDPGSSRADAHLEATFGKHRQ